MAGLGKVPMFTLADAMKMQNSSKGSSYPDPKFFQTQEALLGDYILTDKQAEYEAERRRKGEHGLDDPKGTNYVGVPGGKLPSHPTFSKESPHYIRGLTAAGSWEKLGVDENGKEQWAYMPDKRQFDRPGFAEELIKYYHSEKGNGIDGIWMPNGTLIR